MRADQLVKKFLDFKKCKSHNDKIFVDGDSVYWYYHNNLIMELSKEGMFKFYTDWNTLSTNRRRNLISPYIRFYSKNFDLHCEYCTISGEEKKMNVINMSKMNFPYLEINERLLVSRFR